MPWMLLFVLLMTAPAALASVVVPPPGGGGPHAQTHSPGQSDDISGVYATKAYADAIAQSLRIKASVAVATTEDITLSGEQTINTVETSASRVLVKDQTDPTENGIYVSAAGAWARAIDADSPSEVVSGMFTFDRHTSISWVLIEPDDDPVVLGTTELVFTEFTGAGAIQAGAGTSFDGNVLNIGAGTGITVNADSIGITAGGVTATQIGNNEVALGTKTTGDYVDGVTSGGGLTKTGTEGAKIGMTTCAAGLIKKMNAAGDAWECAQDTSSTDGSLYLLDFGGRPNDDTFDNGPKLQDAINAAQALGVGDAGYPPVVIGPGTWHFSTTVTKKSSPIICAGQVIGSSLVWNGIDTATVISQDPTVPGGTSWGGIENCDLTAGTAAPETWIDFATGNSADVGLRLFNVSINGCKGDCVKVSGWWNLHAFRHNRFDACGGYCISLTTHEEQYLSTFYLRDFTWDNHQQNGALGIGGGLGFIHINNDVEANSTNAGTFVIQNGRVELNDQWAGDIAVVTVTPNTATSSPGIKKVVFRDVTMQDVVLDTGDVLLRSTPASAVGIGLENVIVAQLDDLHEGLTNCDPTPYGAFPHSGRITEYHCGSEYVEFAYGALRVRVPTTPGSTDTGLQVFIGAETVPRFQVNNAGRLSFGDGTNAVDTQIFRAAANRLETGTSDDLRTAGRYASTTQSATCTDNGAGTAGALTLQPTANAVALTNADPHGCAVTLSETSSLSSAPLRIVLISNAGGSVTFADTAGVSHTSGAQSLDVDDVISFVYINSAFYQTGPVQNN